MIPAPPTEPPPSPTGDPVTPDAEPAAVRGVGGGRGHGGGRPAPHGPPGRARPHRLEEGARGHGPAPLDGFGRGKGVRTCDQFQSVQTTKIIT